MYSAQTASRRVGTVCGECTLNEASKRSGKVLQVTVFFVGARRETPLLSSPTPPSSSRQGLLRTPRLRRQPPRLRQVKSEGFCLKLCLRILQPLGRARRHLQSLFREEWDMRECFCFEDTTPPGRGRFSQPCLWQIRVGTRRASLLYNPLQVTDSLMFP